MKRNATKTFAFLARKKGIFGKTEFYYDKKIRAWLVRVNNSSPQIIGDNQLDVAYNIGSGFMNIYKKDKIQ